MTTPQDPGTLGGVVSGGKAAIARMRLARRVAEALLPQPDGVALEAVAPGELLSPGTSDGVSRSDFILSALDMTLGIVLLVGQPASALAASVDAAQSILTANPDTDACVLVADDDELTSRIVEPGEYLQPEAEPTMVGPLRPLVDEYLRLVNPQWASATTVLTDSQLDYVEAAEAASADAVAERAAQPGRVDERQAARRSLSREDAAWAARLALRVAAGDSVNVESEVASARGGVP